MSCVISSKEIIGGEKIGEFYVKGKYYKEGENLLFLKGDVFNYNNEKELFNDIIQKDSEIIPKLKGEFFIIYYSINSNKIYIANDILGRERLFYFFYKNEFILSDDFWEIINLIEPSMSDVDVQSIKEFPIFHYPLFYKTIIKNLYFLPPASIAIYYLDDFNFQIEQYWDFKYKPNKSITLNEAIDKLDCLFYKSMKQIKEKNDPKTIYGVGLSGGLDSRLIPYYALKNNMNLISFIIGEKKPHKFVLSRDHKSARRLARHYNLNHFEVEYDSESFESKSFYDIRNNPMSPSNFFISVQDKVPKFNVLLTGMNGGEHFGSTLPCNIMELNKENLVDVIIKTFSYMYNYKSISFINRLFRKVLKLIFKNYKSPENLNKRNSIDGIIKENEFIEIRSKIIQFVKDNSNKSNIDIFQKYLFWHLVNRNKYGSFCSLFGSKKSYGIFTNPYVVDEMLTWKPEYLINKSLQNHFFIKKFPELAKIPDQDSKLPIFYRNKKVSFYKKFLNYIDYRIRGAGVMRYAHWAWSKKYKKYSIKILSKENKIFFKIFDIKKLLKLDKRDMRLYENIVKIKQILDLIETKGYKDFLKEGK